MKGYSTAIWIIGGVLLLVVVAFIISYAIKEGLIHLKTQDYDTTQIKGSLPMLPSVIKFKRRKKASSFVSILFLIILGIAIVGALAYMIHYYTNQGKDVSEVKPQTSQNYVKCIQLCTTSSQNYDLCVKGCIKNEKESNN